MPTQLPPIPDNISDLAGPLLVGYLLNWGLFGALCVQVYNYHLSFPDDSRVSKAVVYGVFLVEIMQTLVVTRDCFAVYAKGFGDMNALNDIQTIWLSAPIFIGTVSCTVQMYYAYRVYVLSQSKILVVAIATISLFQYSGAIAQGVQAYNLGEVSELATKAFVTCSIWLAGSAACDILITCSMAWLLLRRHNLRIQSTHNIVIKLVRLIIETGVLTATTATIDIILFLRFPSSPFHTTTSFALAKLYSNSLLVLFNNRAHLERGAGLQDLSGASAGTGSRGRGFSLGTNSAQATRTQIRIEQTTYVETDGIPLEDTSTKKRHSLSDV